MSLYLRCMLLAFLANGAGAFGLRILAGAGLGTIDERQYLSWWYACGAVVALTVYLAKAGRPELREIVIGFVMALCSLGGQVGMALSLSGGISGFVVFPVATGGGVFLVAAIGKLICREKVGSHGVAGLLVGFLALVMLSLPE